MIFKKNNFESKIAHEDMVVAFQPLYTETDATPKFAQQRLWVMRTHELG